MLIHDRLFCLKLGRFLAKQFPVYIGSESPAIRFTSLRSVPAPVRFKLLRQTFPSKTRQFCGFRFYIVTGIFVFTFLLYGNAD
jgi:hypothetical protein